MELRNAWWDEDQSALSVDGQPLGQPGEDSDLVELALIELDATIGADNFQISDNGEMLATVAGQNYGVFLATVKRADGTADDNLLFFGVRTSAKLGDSGGELPATTIESPGDGETVDPLAPISGTTAPNAEVKLFLDGINQATGTSDGDGAYEFAGDSPMTGGEGSEHTVQVKAVGAQDSPTITITLSA